MSISATKVFFDGAMMWLELSDQRIIGVPIIWFPRLYYATPQQRADLKISSDGIHWEGIDEDISIDGILAGHGDDTKWGMEQRKQLEKVHA